SAGHRSCLTPFAKRKDFLKVWIHYQGPEKILAWAAERDRSIQWEGMYGHRCQACIRVYRDPAVRAVIQNHYQQVIPDVLQSAWLREHYIPQKLAALSPA